MKSTASRLAPVALFRRLVDEAGGIPTFARTHGRARALVWQIYHGRRPVPPSWCEGLPAPPEQLRPDHLFVRGPDGRLYWRPR